MPGKARWLPALAGVGVFAAAFSAAAENWRFGASAGLTGSYTNNVDYSERGDQGGDFATSLSASLSIRGQGARVQLNGSIGASWQLYATNTQYNSIAPNVNLTGRVEAIDNFFFIDATASATTSFLSPFGPQPDSIVTATSNRYIQQSYSVSPYIQGVLGSTNITYQVRDENIWTASSSFGDSSNRTPNTYANTLTATLNSGTNPLGWNFQYVRSYYDNGLAGDALGGSYTTQIARLTVPFRIDPQIQVSGRIGYEKNDFPVSSEQSLVYGAGFNWSPTERTHMGGFWEERFFGSSFSWQLSHRLPNAAISASFSRGLSSYPQLALAIPAGVTVSQFIDAAFTTRIPDPVERALAVEEFLARTGLPPTLAAPVNFYGYSLTLQNSKRISLVLIGLRNSLSFSVFDVDSTAISGTGDALPPALQLGQDNTQTGVGIGYSRQLTGFTSMSASAGYSRARSDDTSSNAVRSNNTNFSISLNTQITPKTSGSAGVTYSMFRPTGTIGGSGSEAFTAYIGIRHSF